MRGGNELWPFFLMTEGPGYSLMDGQMPDMDGYQATKLIRASQDPSVRSVKIVALTASAAQGDRERCLEVGMECVSIPYLFCFGFAG
jgi:CheY-like chemotaxis protein